MMPDMSGLRAVTERLERRGIAYALGGSGLLYSLGLTETARDWDIATDAPKADIVDALRPLRVQEKKSGDYPFATEYKLLVHPDEPQVEVLGGFSIYSDKGLCRLPAFSVNRWEGIRMASAEVWHAAYALMGRTEKAGMLLDYLKQNGVDREIVRFLLDNPLPDHVAVELAALLR